MILGETDKSFPDQLAFIGIFFCLFFIISRGGRFSCYIAQEGKKIMLARRSDRDEGRSSICCLSTALY